MEEYHWQMFLRRLSRRGEPADFKEFIGELAATSAVDPEIVAGVYPMVIADDIAKTMLAVSLQLPAAEAERTLQQIADTAARAQFKKGLRKVLSPRERDWHRRVVGIIRNTVIPGTAALAAMFRAYIRGDYDLEQDPNRLVWEASQMVRPGRHRPSIGRRRRPGSSLEPALALVGQAGALALRGKPLWDRWADEANPPVDAWMLVMNGAIEHFAFNRDIFPLEAIEDARPRWREILEPLSRKLPITEGEPVTRVTREYVEGLFDDLEPFLEGEEVPTPEVLAQLPKPREDYIDLLWRNITQWDEWDVEEPDVVFFLSNMIVLLGLFRAEKAINPLIDVVAGTAGTDAVEMAEEAVNALALIGEPAREAVLNFLQYSQNDRARAELAPAAPDVAVDDPRTFPILAQLFQEIDWEDGKASVVYALATLGDMQAVPLLKAALEEPGLDPWYAAELQEALDDLEAG